MRQTKYLPITFFDEPLDEVTANDAERTNNDRLILHILPHSWSLRFGTPPLVFLAESAAKALIVAAVNPGIQPNGVREKQGK
ncbi:MAG: hypothetical protein ABSF41_04815 [Pseudolabrys sp.]